MPLPVTHRVGGLCAARLDVGRHHTGPVAGDQQQLGACPVHRERGVGQAGAKPHPGGEELRQYDPLCARSRRLVAELPASPQVLADVTDLRFELHGRYPHVLSLCRLGRCRVGVAQPILRQSAWSCRLAWCP